MEIRHLNIADTEIYITPIISSADKARDRERATEKVLLGEIFGHTVDLQHTNEGKPHINEKKFISISHTKKHLTIALSDTKPIGIDIELISERINRVKERFLNEEELLKVKSLNHLALCWSAKEAIYKINDKAGALGENIRINIDELLRSNVFSAFVEDKKYTVNIVEQLNDYEIVLAYECI